MTQALHPKQYRLEAEIRAQKAAQQATKHAAKTLAQKEEVVAMLDSDIKIETAMATGTPLRDQSTVEQGWGGPAAQPRQANLVADEPITTRVLKQDAKVAKK